MRSSLALPKRLSSLYDITPFQAAIHDVTASGLLTTSGISQKGLDAVGAVGLLYCARASSLRGVTPMAWTRPRGQDAGDTSALPKNKRGRLEGGPLTIHTHDRYVFSN
jgi:hypothetical protein